MQVIRTPPSAVRTVDSEEGDGQRGEHGLAGGGAVPGARGQNSLAGQKHEGVGVGSGLRFDEHRATGLPRTCESHVSPLCQRKKIKNKKRKKTMGMIRLSFSLTHYRQGCYAPNACYSDGFDEELRCCFWSVPPQSPDGRSQKLARRIQRVCGYRAREA